MNAASFLRRSLPVLLAILISASLSRAGSGKWKAPAKTSSPSATASDWWSLFQDRTLPGLIASLDVSSPELSAAIQRVEQARGRMDAVRSALFPSIDTSAGGSRSKLSLAADNPPASGFATRWEAGITASYEVDLWGRVRNSVRSARALVLADQASVEALRLSLRAELADAYITMRGVEAEQRVVEDALRTRRTTLKLTFQRTENGLSSDLEVEQARTDLASAEADAATLGQLRMEMENVVALLAGQSATEFRLKNTGLLPAMPAIPSILPGDLLRRRPDVVAAERRIDSALAGIGTAKAAYYPTLQVRAGAGLIAGRASNLDEDAARDGHIGFSFSVPLFDGGRRRAKLKEAEALHGELQQSGRQQVLAAIADAETAMGKVHWTGQQRTMAGRAADAAAKAAALTTLRYEAGTVNILQQLLAERLRLDAARSSVRARTAQLRAAVTLIRALGGGWIAAR
jgi:multidrug efflux system outer membrane protein